MPVIEANVPIDGISHEDDYFCARVHLTYKVCGSVLGDGKMLVLGKEGKYIVVPGC